jgi:dolichyl-phosphate-mannose-protein mannosyltransferase
MRLIPFGVAVVAAALYFAGLGEAPFVDPPEGVHAEIAREMAAGGDALTPRLNGVRVFDRPPLLYWLMAGGFSVTGVSAFMARFWSALAAVACATVTARVGMLLGGPRVGLLAGLMTAANLGIFVFGRLVRPDLLFVLCITLAQAGFVLAYLGRGGRRGLIVFYAALGLATLTKDLLGAVGPLLATALFLWLTRERPLKSWWPWWGIGVFAVLALPWYLGVEAANRGFLWHLIVDHHLLALVRPRIFPGADGPVGPLQFLAVTAAAFLPWSLLVPWAVARSLRRDWEQPADRLWMLFALWALLVISFFTLSPFRGPHDGLPAFPALALLVARLWEEAMMGAPRAVSVRALLVPVAVAFAVVAVAVSAVWAGLLPVPRGTLAAVDASTRNLVAQGTAAPERPLDPFRPVLLLVALVFGAGAVGLAVAAWRRSTELGVTVALAVVLAFLPAAGKGMVEFARARSAEPIALALARRVNPGDVIVHEGPLEHSASVLLTLKQRIRVVDGLMSDRGFAARFPDARDVFWDAGRVPEAWTGPGRGFLISTVAPDRSLVRSLPPARVHLLAVGGGRRLYSNLAD